MTQRYLSMHVGEVVRIRKQRWLNFVPIDQFGVWMTGTITTVDEVGVVVQTMNPLDFVRIERDNYVLQIQRKALEEGRYDV